MEPCSEKGNLSRKGKKAYHRLESLNSELAEMKSTLDDVQKIICTIATKDEKCKSIGRTRSIVLKEIPRVVLSFIGLEFYIDFTISVSERDGSLELNGNIIYGTMRTQCYANCPYSEIPDTEKKEKKETEKEKECMNCERVSRCDHLDDKPILKFSLNRHGMIKSTELRDEWWIKENKEESDEMILLPAKKAKKDPPNKDTLEEVLKDMHYRALDFIWKEALDWNNEIIMP